MNPIQLDGQPYVSPHNYQLAKGECGACGKLSVYVRTDQPYIRCRECVANESTQEDIARGHRYSAMEKEVHQELGRETTPTYVTLKKCERCEASLNNLEEMGQRCHQCMEDESRLAGLVSVQSAQAARADQRAILDECIKSNSRGHSVTGSPGPSEAQSMKPNPAQESEEPPHGTRQDGEHEARYGEESKRLHMEGLDGIYVHTIQVAVMEAEKKVLQRLADMQLTPVGTADGSFGTVCKDWTKMLDVLAKQEVTNETLSYIPMKVSAVNEDDVVLGYITMVERQMEKERLPLMERPSIVVTGSKGRTYSRGKGETREDVSVFGYVDPGAAHSVIRRDVVEKAGVKVFTDPRAARMQGFGNATDKPMGFCFLVNEVKGRDMQGNVQVARFITMPMVVEETTVKFPYLLGAEITNRIHLRYMDERQMRMQGDGGELVIDRIDGKEMISRLNVHFGTIITDASDSDSGGNSEREDQVVEKAIINKKMADMERFEMEWSGRTEMMKAKVVYRRSLFPSVSDYLFEARTEGRIGGDVRLIVQLAEGGQHIIPGFWHTQVMTKTGDPVVIDRAFKGCIECVRCKGCAKHYQTEGTVMNESSCKKCKGSISVRCLTCLFGDQAYTKGRWDSEKRRRRRTTLEEVEPTNVHAISVATEDKGTTKVYRSVATPLTRQAMEEVMKAIQAPTTKPLAFLAFADMYKSDPSPYIIEGLTNLAVKHAEYIPGVSTQLVALTMREAELKTQILAYYDRKDGKSASLRMDRDLQVALLDELAVTIGPAYDAAREGAKAIGGSIMDRQVVVVNAVVNRKIAECVRAIWNDIWREGEDDKGWSSLLDSSEASSTRAAIQSMILSETGTGVVITEHQMTFMVERLEEFIRFKATTLKSFGFIDEIEFNTAVRDEVGIDQYFQEVWKTGRTTPGRMAQSTTKPDEFDEPDQRKPPDKTRHDGEKENKNTGHREQRVQRRRIVTNKIRKEMKSLRQARAQAAEFVIQALVRILAVQEGMRKLKEEEIPDMISVASVMMEEGETKKGLSARGIEEFRRKHCNNKQPELRPELFPEELWEWVMDEEKERVQERWSRYTPERLKTLLKEVMAIKISQEDEGRRKESPLIRAQILANIDKYGHPDPNKPPNIKDFVFKISLVDGAVPFRTKPRRLSILERMSLAARVAIMLENGQISPSRSAWSSPIKLVPFPERINAFLSEHQDNAQGKLSDPTLRATVAVLYRLTGDFRQLNDLTKMEVFPLPRIPELIDKMKGKDRYSTSDIQDAFFTVCMDEESRPYTAFQTPDALYEYNVMPQGVKGAASFFASIVGKVFAHLQHKAFTVYQDDVANHESESITTHLELQQEIYDALGKNSMCLKPSKTFMNYSSQRILGHILDKKGRRPDPKTTEAISKMRETLSTVSEVRSLMGLATVVREYIPAMATLLAPIQALMRKDVDVAAEWRDDVHGEAFRALKKALVSQPILMGVSELKPFVVVIDACRVGRGIGAILMQEDDDGVLHPVAYWSRGLLDAERRYSATELECTALHNAILHWKSYLNNGLPFTVITDHYALVYMVTKTGGDAHQRLARLCMDLQGFTFSVKHRSGDKNLLADAVSRLFQVNDIPPVMTSDELRDDFAPLTREEREKLESEFGQDAEFIIHTIEDHRLQVMEEEQKNIQKRIDEMITVRMTPAEKVTSAKPIKETKPTDKSGKLNGQKVVNGKGETPWYESSGLDKDGIMEGISHQQISPSLMQYIKENDVMQPDDTVNYFPITMAMSQLSPYTPENVVYVHAQQIRQDGKDYQYRRRSRRIADRLELEEASTEQRIQEEILRQSRAHAKVMRKLKERVKKRERRADQNERASTAKEKKTQDGPRELTAEEIETREAMEEFDDVLSNYDYLVSRLYMDPDTKQLYEVINTRYNRLKGTIVSTAMPIDDSEHVTMQPREVQEREVIRSDGKGTVRLVFEMSSAFGGQEPWPKSEVEWLQCQQQDQFCVQLIERIADVETRVLLKADNQDDYFCRQQIHDEAGKSLGLGPILRRFLKEEEYTHGEETITRQAVRCQIVLPKACIHQCLVMCHEGLAHPGRRKTEEAVQHRYYWPTIKSSVCNHVMQCHFCMKRKVDRHRAKVPIQKYHKQGTPWQRVHFDSCGPFQTSKQGNKYIVVFKCALTKWVEIKAIPALNAREIAAAFLEAVQRHGCPRQIVTDRGSENDNNLMKEIVAILGLTRHVKTTPYNPRSDGQAENHMATLKDQLSSYINEFHDNWDEHVGMVAQAYRTTRNEATGFTPFFLMHGREMSQSDEVHIEALDQQMESLEGYSLRLAETLKFIWNYVGQRVTDNVDNYNRRPKEPLQFRPYQVGDYFMLKRVPKPYLRGKKRQVFKLTYKLQERWTGPFRVVKVISDILYDADIHGAIKRVHAVNMKPGPISRDSKSMKMI